MSVLHLDVTGVDSPRLTIMLVIRARLDLVLAQRMAVRLRWEVEMSDILMPL